MLFVDATAEPLHPEIVDFVIHHPHLPISEEAPDGYWDDEIERQWHHEVKGG